MKKKLFLKNALILTSTAILLRGAGIVFRIYISNKIGAEGMGLHQLIFSVYTFASALASSGISVATTRLIAEKGERKNAADKIMRRALSLSIAFGLFSCALMFFGADAAAGLWLGDMRAAPSLRILSVGLPFMALSSCLKGYFIARRKASTPSNSQLFEQAVRIGIVALMFTFTDTSNLTYACAAVVTGNAVSEIGALLYIYIGYRRDIGGLVSGGSVPTHIMRSLSYIFIPIALSSYLNTILHTIENIIVPDALTRYTFSREVALSQFGMLKGMAIPVLFFPSSFLGALSALLIPEVSANKAGGKAASIRNTVSHTMFITSASSILIGALFALYGGEIGQAVYKSGEVGLYIQILGPIVPFMYMESIVIGLLNGLDCQQASLRFNVYNSAIRITLITVFVPRFGMTAFLAIMILSNIFTSWLNLRQLFDVTYMRPDTSKWLIKPLLALVPSIFCACALKAPLLLIFKNDVAVLISGIFVMCIVYIAFLFILKCVTKSDIAPLIKRRKREDLC